MKPQKDPDYFTIAIIIIAFLRILIK